LNWSTILVPENLGMLGWGPYGLRETLNPRGRNMRTLTGP